MDLAPLVGVGRPVATPAPSYWLGLHPIRRSDTAMPARDQQPDLMARHAPSGRLQALRQERDQLRAVQHRLLTDLVHRDPHALEAATRAATDALTGIRSRIAEVRDLERTLDGVPASFRIDDWADLPDPVRDGLRAAHALLTRFGLTEKLDLLRDADEPVRVHVLTDAQFTALWRSVPGREGRPEAAALADIGGALSVRASTFTVDGLDAAVRNAQLTGAAGLLLHEWIHVVVDPWNAGRASEHQAWLAENHFVRAQSAMLGLETATGPERARLQRVLDGWLDVLGAWRPYRPAPPTYPLPAGYDTMPGTGDPGPERGTGAQ